MHTQFYSDPNVNARTAAWLSKEEVIKFHDHPTQWLYDGPRSVASLKKGDIVLVHFVSYGQGMTQICEFVGLQRRDVERDWGDNTTDYDSLKEAKKDTGCRNLEQLEDHDADPRIVLRAIAGKHVDNNEGAWVHLFGQKWCWGSGSHGVRFCGVKEYDQAEFEKDKLREHLKTIMACANNDANRIDARIKELQAQRKIVQEQFNDAHNTLKELDAQ